MTNRHKEDAKNIAVNDEILAVRDSILKSVSAERIYLFGSYAYGAPNAYSDYDFYVVLSDDSKLKPLEAMQKIERDFSGEIRKPVDFLANYKTRFKERSAFPTLERKIAREGILLYGAN
ncbi:putative nucleotidyltransferases [Candidatus Termititenax aidoneus]|uniref:Nucleotidyltransferases n=1 Tax=Termititenax aidoneus TaxID=2218524 RepID=A0A388TC14_TERA1|nr:putative nucleotidyltransferases [Candidatus Termititenax aidoneus]